MSGYYICYPHLMRSLDTIQLNIMGHHPHRTYSILISSTSGVHAQSTYFPITISKESFPISYSLYISFKVFFCFIPNPFFFRIICSIPFIRPKSKPEHIRTLFIIYAVI